MTFVMGVADLLAVVIIGSLLLGSVPPWPLTAIVCFILVFKGIPSLTLRV